MSWKPVMYLECDAPCLLANLVRNEYDLLPGTAADCVNHDGIVRFTTGHTCESKDGNPPGQILTSLLRLACRLYLQRDKIRTMRCAIHVVWTSTFVCGKNVSRATVLAFLSHPPTNKEH